MEPQVELMWRQWLVKALQVLSSLMAWMLLQELAWAGRPLDVALRSA
jgi:hypothetical protein